jgi:hypothetical protein
MPLKKSRAYSLYPRAIALSSIIGPRQPALRQCTGFTIRALTEYDLCADYVAAQLLHRECRPAHQLWLLHIRSAPPHQCHLGTIEDPRLARKMKYQSHSRNRRATSLPRNRQLPTNTLLLRVSRCKTLSSVYGMAYGLHNLTTKMC